MIEVPFRLKFEGGDAKQHELPAYDGYMALAGFARSLVVITHYIETAKIRQRGDFEGKSMVKAKPIGEGSVLADFVVNLTHDPVVLATASDITKNIISSFVYDVVKRTINRCIGQYHGTSNTQLLSVEESKLGDLEALAAIIEPAIKTTHNTIGKGVNIIIINGNHNHISTFDSQTRDYVNTTIEDAEVITKALSVASFNANSGYGSVFDEDHGRVIPIKLSGININQARPILTWGLHEYASGTRQKVFLKFTRRLALDGTPKQYIVVDAMLPE